MMLITLEQARAQVRVDQSDSDTDLEGAVRAASAAVITYLKTPSFADSSGLIPTDSAGIALDVPDDIQWATRLLVGDFFKNREPTPDDAVPSEYGFGFLPRAVVALLYPYRIPTVSTNTTRRPWWPGCGWDRGCCW